VIDLVQLHMILIIRANINSLILANSEIFVLYSFCHKFKSMYRYAPIKKPAV